MRNALVSKETHPKPIHPRLNQAELFSEIFLLKQMKAVEKKGENKNHILDNRVAVIK